MAKVKHKEDKWIALLLIIALLAMMVFLLVRCVALDEKDPWQEQYDLGVRYLDDGNYEEAVLSFLAAIDIDPKRPDAYAGAAKAYVALGDYEAAIEILTEGIKNTGDEDLEEDLEDIQEDMVDDRPEDTGPEDDGTEDGDLLPTEEPDRPLMARVVDAYCDYIENGINNYGEVVTTCFHIPEVLLADGSSAPASEAIYQELSGMLQDRVYQYDDEESYSMRYQWNQKDEYVSIITEFDYFGEYYWTSYEVYLVSAETGEMLPSLELLKAYGYTEEAFYDAVAVRLAAYFESYDNLQELAGENQYNYVVSATLAEDNLRLTIPYIGPTGDLCILAYVYWPAGAGAYWQIMPLEETGDCGSFTCTSNHSAGSAEAPVAYTASKIQDMVVDYYNQNMEYRYEGNFVAFDGETFEDGNTCNVIVRFQHTEDDPTIGANLLVALVSVDKSTGAMTADGEYLDDLW